MAEPKEKCHLCSRKRISYVEMDVQGKKKSICEECYKMHIAIPRQPVEDEGECPNCGVVTRPSDKFCYNCGEPLEKACPECGADVEPSDSFCANCGKKIDFSLNP